MPSFTEVKRPCQIQGEVSRDYMSATCHKEHLVNLRRRGFASTPKNLKSKPQPNEDQTNPWVLQSYVIGQLKDFLQIEQNPLLTNK